jgi:hypothetical protein
MKHILFFYFFCYTLINAQNDSAELSHFINLFQSEISKYPIGEIEAHFDEGYFKAKSESDYFEINQKLGLSTIYNRCLGKEDSECKEQISFYLEQLKTLKKERAELSKKLENFEEVVSLLKIRIYPISQKINYEKTGIFKENNTGMIEVIVFDLPTGVGGVNKSHLSKWKISSEEAYELAKSNTLKDISRKFLPIHIDNTNQDYNILINENDLFITSAILDLKKLDMPMGKYGTLISVPDNTVILSQPIEKKENLNIAISDFQDLTINSPQNENSKPISTNIFWYDAEKLHLIQKEGDKFIIPKKLKKVLD